MDPTPEQCAAVDLFKTGQSLKINAFAGTGKTTTLELIGKSTTRKGIYLAFNKSVAEDAKKRFPFSVRCQTTHSVAFQGMPAGFRKVPDKLAGKMNGNGIARTFGLRRLHLTSELVLMERSQGFMIAETVKKFCQSGDAEISTDHVQSRAFFALLSPEQIIAFKSFVTIFATKLWSRMIDPADPTPLGHDGYLKWWALSEPRLQYDYILLDEAQDSNGAVLHVLRKQQSQIVFVGDRHQQLYEWRGAINAMQQISTPGVTSLTQSFRFGDAIADGANQLLSLLDEQERVRGNPSLASKLTNCAKPHAVLCRTNATVMAVVLQHLQQGGQPYLVGGPGELIRLLQGVANLQRGQPCDVPELYGFSNWRDVEKFSETPEGEELRSLVRIVQSFGVHGLIQALEKTVAQQENADLVISTAHKSKGLEWETVKMADDFFGPKYDALGQEVIDPAEVRLLYVTLTRAKREVEPSSAYHRYVRAA
ncbi:MAG: UvrD-helicase domain-containing protein [Burkholderiales bacterium]